MSEEKAVPEEAVELIGVFRWGSDWRELDRTREGAAVNEVTDLLAAIRPLLCGEEERRLREELNIARANLEGFADPAIRESVAAYSQEKLARKAAEQQLSEVRVEVEANVEEEVTRDRLLAILDSTPPSTEPDSPEVTATDLAQGLRDRADFVQRGVSPGEALQIHQRRHRGTGTEGAQPEQSSTTGNSPSTEPERCGGSGMLSIGVNEDFDTGALEADDEKPCPGCPDCTPEPGDGERLIKIAERLEAAAQRRDISPATEQAEADAELLRNLASRLSPPRESDGLNALGEIASRVGRIRIYLSDEFGDVDAESALVDADEAAEFFEPVRAALRRLSPENSSGVEERL